MRLRGACTAQRQTPLAALVVRAAMSGSSGKRQVAAPPVARQQRLVVDASGNHLGVPCAQVAVLALHHNPDLPAAGLDEEYAAVLRVGPCLRRLSRVRHFIRRRACGHRDGLLKALREGVLHNDRWWRNDRGVQGGLSRIYRRHICLYISREPLSRKTQRSVGELFGSAALLYTLLHLCVPALAPAVVTPSMAQVVPDPGVQWRQSRCCLPASPCGPQRPLEAAA